MSTIKSVKISDCKIGFQEKVFVIAEVGINHDGDVEKARKLIDEAKASGASAVKMQSYITEKRVKKDSPIFGILKKCELSFADQKRLFTYAHDKNIEIFSTPFDDESVDFLSEAGVSCYKIASFDIAHMTLLKKISEKKKPVIMSRGMATLEEIDNAIAIFRKMEIDHVLLHCVSAYPVTDKKSLNLSTIRFLEERYQCPVGFSDHTIGIDVAITAVAAGAVAIEKHFTLSRNEDGPDHAMSTEPQEFKEMVRKISEVQELLGKPALGFVDAEKDILQYRRTS